MTLILLAEIWGNAFSYIFKLSEKAGGGGGGWGVEIPPQEFDVEPLVF